MLPSAPVSRRAPFRLARSPAVAPPSDDAANLATTPPPRAAGIGSAQLLEAHAGPRRRRAPTPDRRSRERLAQLAADRGRDQVAGLDLGVDLDVGDGRPLEHLAGLGVGRARAPRRGCRPASARARNARRWASSANSSSTSHGGDRRPSRWTSSAIATNSAFSSTARRAGPGATAHRRAPHAAARRRARGRRPAARPALATSPAYSLRTLTFGVLVDDRHRRLGEPGPVLRRLRGCPPSAPG